jgi:hypothetical protein
MIDQKLIFFPLLAQVLLTAIVWVWMYKTRIEKMKRSRINPQALSNTADASVHIKSVTAPADNFKNLFEIPVLFYIAVIMLYVTQMVDGLFLTLAGIFVLLRYIHSFVHITYNNVMHRFTAYALSTLMLWVIWIMMVIRLM